MFEQNVTLGPGTGTFTQHTLEIVIMMLGFSLIGLWLGWALWAKYKQQADKLALDNQSLSISIEALRSESTEIKNRLATIENDNTLLTDQTISLQRDNSHLLQQLASLEAELAALMVTNRQLDTELGLSNTPDTPLDKEIPLEVVANTVPEVTTELSPVVELTVEPDIIMAENPPAPFVIEPIAVVEAAPEKKKATAKKADADIAAPKMAAMAGTSDDLSVVEGIGPKIQMLLNQYDIYTYRQLAETDVDRLKEILATAGPQLAMHDPGTWPSQANLAANDQWDTLKSVQGFLKGGKKPT